MSSSEPFNENLYVHQVYNQIASHFSITRYKPWPIVVNFLNTRQVGSIGLDAGCGNGKYLDINPNIYIIGSDYSTNLIKICNERGFESLISDASCIPLRNNSLDFAISIAVIHHFSTRERRLLSVIELLRTLKISGQVLIYVWAFEQTIESKRKFDTQDVLVPWNVPKSMQDQDPDKVYSKLEASSVNDSGDIVYNRYYHMFVEGELNQLVVDSGLGIVVESGYERDNWWIIAERI